MCGDITCEMKSNLGAIDAFWYRTEKWGPKQNTFLNNSILDNLQKFKERAYVLASADVFVAWRISMAGEILVGTNVQGILLLYCIVYTVLEMDRLDNYYDSLCCVLNTAG
jgi:hypothetical protein